MTAALPGRRRRNLGLVLAAALGVFLVQLAWSAAVPPFRGLDEYSHVFRAESVADGYWRPADTGPTRGNLVVASEKTVAAARPVCLSLTTKEDESTCFPTARLGDSQVQVASRASNYDPSYYAIIGLPTRPWSGFAGLYAMRLLSGMLCALLAGWALSLLARKARSPWPVAAALLTLTPVATYSFMVVAPNGLEMACGLLVWASLLPATATDRRVGKVEARVGFLVGAFGLALLRTLGPVWLVLIIASAAVLVGRKALAIEAGQRIRRLAMGVAVVLAMAVGMSWSLYAGTNDPASVALNLHQSPWPDIWFQPVLWLLQAIGAFPARDEMAPLPVYAIVGAALWIAAALGWRQADGRERRVLAALLVVSVAIPLAITLRTYEQIGFAWQGRYGWPLSMGVVLILGVVLDRVDWLSDRRQRALGVIGVAFLVALATAWSQVHVLHRQLVSSPLADSSSWVHPATWAVVVLTFAGFGLLTAAGLGMGDHISRRRVASLDR